jgi:hypothetical protein
VDWEKYGYPNDDQERERIWAEEFHQKRKRFVETIESAVRFTSPSRRRDLYEEWRKEHGDDWARARAKFAEGVVAGRLKLDKLKKGVEEYEKSRNKELF